MIARCPHCQKKLEIADNLAGKQVRCANPACQNAFTVPAVPASAPPTAAAPPPPPPAAAPAVPPPPQVAQVPATPPPMPGSSPTPAPAAAPTPAEETLPTLSPPPPPKPSKSFWQSVTEKFSAGGSQVKKRAKALKLGRDVNKLNNDLNQQMLALYSLAIQHRPEQVDMNNELNELSQLQAQINEKQATLSSLEQTKASGSVIKPLKQEIGQFQARQQELMIQIGTKTNTSRPDLPGAAGSYGAIDQLRATQQQKQAELQQLQAEIGPIVDTGTVATAKQSGLKYLPHAIGAIAAILILYFGIGWVWGLLFGGIGDFAYYVPDDASGMVYISVDELRDSDLEIISELFDSADEMVKGNSLPLKIASDDVKEVFVILGSGPEKITIVMKTAEDMDLDEIVKDYNKDNVKSHKDIDYVQIGSRYQGMYLAKTDNKTYCMSGDEENLKSVLKQFSRKEKAELDDALQDALDFVDGEDHFAVMKTSSAQGMPGIGDMSMMVGDAQAIGIGVSINSSIDAKATVFFKDKDDAADLVEEMEKGLEEGIEELEDMLDEARGREKEQMETALQMMKAIDIDQSGKAIEFEWDYDTDEVNELLDDFVGEIKRNFMQEFRQGF